jgi:hypothetical protein
MTDDRTPSVRPVIHEGTAINPPVSLFVGGPADGKNIPFHGQAYQVPAMRPVDWASDRTAVPFDVVIYHKHVILLGGWTYSVASPILLPTPEQQAHIIDRLVEHPSTATFRIRRANR